MRTTFFGQQLIKAAEDVLQVEYRAGNRNRFGERLERIVKEFDSGGSTRFFKGAGKQLPDYCGITVSVIIDRALQMYNGQANTYRSASAKWFKDNARRFNLRMDKVPRDGCLFLTKRSGGSGYHIGFVWEVSADGRTIKTIEGNTWSSSSFHVRKTGCKIKLGNNEFGILSRTRRTDAIYSFIHIEELFDTLVVDFPRSAAMLADYSNGDFSEENILAVSKKLFSLPAHLFIVVVVGYGAGISAV